LTAGRFLRRLNRFAALVEVGGRRVRAHVANSGRLRELFFPGAPVYLRRQGRAGRRCPYDLALVRVGPTLVSADARLPNALVAEALRAGRIAPLRGFGPARAEVRHGDHRLDFVLERRGVRCLVETKSCTLVEGGVALFPDAPTVRGRHHVEALARARRRGTPAAVIFVVQRHDATRFRPNVAADPAFARALGRAAAAGVRILAYRCRISRRAVSIAEPIRVELPSDQGPGRPPFHTSRGQALSPSRGIGGSGRHLLCRRRDPSAQPGARQAGPLHRSRAPRGRGDCFQRGQA
jgi:sugar fermentation stimulation protein A